MSNLNHRPWPSLGTRKRIYQVVALFLIFALFGIFINACFEAAKRFFPHSHAYYKAK